MKDKIKLILILMCVFLLVGCGVKDGDKDVHYKPSEYKHNVAISNANRAVEDINKEIISFGEETSVDIIVNTYNESMETLKTHLTKLEETKKLLKEESDLTSGERKSWENSYKSTIEYVNNTIKEIEGKKKKLYELN